MAVYTELTHKDIHSLLSRYDLGELQQHQGIEGGVENTNYFLEIAQPGSTRRYVLTLFEYQPKHTLPFFIDYIDELNIAGLPVPNAIQDREGVALQSVKQKPAVVVPCLPGHHLDTINNDHCRQVGELLGKVHTVGLSSTLSQTNHRGIHWLDDQQQRLNSLLSAEQAGFMAEQWRDIRKQLFQLPSIPQGLIHGDLFRDNVLFDGSQLTGVIDFYQSCHDFLLYDLAVTVNDWCLDDSLELNSQRTKALLQSYNSFRDITQEEKMAWPLMLRLAAFRFWISRIITFVHPEKAVDTAHKEAMTRNFLNPEKFRIVLEKHSESTQVELHSNLIEHI